MADESKDPANAAAGKGRSETDPKDGEKVDIKKLFADLTAQVAGLATAQVNTDKGLRSLLDKQVTNLRKEIAETIRGSGESNGEAPSASELRLAALEKQTRENSRDTKMARFFQDFPDAREHWDDIMKIMEDENQAALVANRRDDGSLDFYASYHNALNKVLASKLRAGKAAGEAAAAKAKADQANTRAQADLGGGAGLESVPESLTLADVEKMTPEQMEKMGLTKLFPGLMGD